MSAPGDDNSSSDATLDAYFDDVVGSQRSILESLFRRRKIKFRREFDHLIVHSNAEGLYLPQDFPEVLICDDEKIPGGMIGSTPQLLRECERLARLLDIPRELSKDADELWEAADSQGEGEEMWQRYGVETFSCVALIEACRKSLDTGAAIVFA